MSSKDQESRLMLQPAVTTAQGTLALGMRISHRLWLGESCAWIKSLSTMPRTVQKVWVVIWLVFGLAQAVP